MTVITMQQRSLFRALVTPTLVVVVLCAIYVLGVLISAGGDPLAFTLLGTRFGTAGIVILSASRTTITLDDGTFWTVSTADREQALDWRAADEVVIVQPTEGADTWRLVNLRHCEVIPAERTS